MATVQEAGPESSRPRKQGARPSFLRNSFSNVLIGASNALLTLAVPPVLARTLGMDVFSAWVVVLQLALYVNFLNLGFQNGVSRFVAFYSARDDRRRADSVASTGLIALAGMAALGVGIVLLLSLWLTRAFPHFPPDLVPSGRWALCLVGVGLAVGLPVSSMWGVFLGFQRNDLVAVIQVGTRAATALCLVIAAYSGAGLVLLAALYAACHLCGYACTVLIHHREAFVRFSKAAIDRTAFAELWGFVRVTLIWFVAMIPVVGLDTALVARFDFASVGVYGACAAAALTLTGIQQAVFNPILQVSAAHSGAGSNDALPGLVLKATRLGTLLLLAVILPIILFAESIIALWLGEGAAGHETMLRLLLTSHFLRLIWAPYALVLLGILRHRDVVVAPLVEAVVNIASSLYLGAQFGVVGVAAGALVGACAGNIMVIFVNMRRTAEVTPARWQLIRRSVVRPLLCFTPAVLALAVAPWLAKAAWLVVAMVSFIASLGCAWRWGLVQQERSQFLQLLRRIPWLAARE